MDIVETDSWPYMRSRLPNAQMVEEEGAFFATVAEEEELTQQACRLVVAYIEQRQMVPFFRAERIADGILATTELIVAQANEATALSGFDVIQDRTGAVLGRLGLGPGDTLLDLCCGNGLMS